MPIHHTMYCNTKLVEKCQCCQQRVAFPDAKGAADRFGDDDAARTVDAAHDTADFPIQKSPCFTKYAVRICKTGRFFVCSFLTGILAGPLTAPPGDRFAFAVHTAERKARSAPERLPPPPAHCISAAVDHNVFAVYKLAFVRGDKQTQVDDLLRLCRSSHKRFHF